MRVGVSCVVLLAAIACGHKSENAAPPPGPAPTVAPRASPPTPATTQYPGLAEAPPAPTDAEFEVMMAKAVTMMEDMGKAVEVADDYCGRAAAGLAKVMDDNRAFMEATRQWNNNPALDKMMEAWMTKHRDKVMPPMTKVGEANTRCASNPEFAAVMKRLEEYARIAEAPTDAEFDAMMAKAIAMFDAMGKAVDAAGGDCDKLAAGMSKVFDDNQDFMEAAKLWKDRPEMDKKAEEWMKANMDKVMPSMMKVGEAGQRCASNARFIEVMKRMDELK